MTIYYVRCKNQSCRHRRKMKKLPSEYADGIGPKCDVCGRRGWYLEPMHYPSRKQCNCGKVIGRDGPYPHEPGHPLCDRHPQGKHNQLRREGLSDFDIACEIGGEDVNEPEPPF